MSLTPREHLESYAEELRYDERLLEELQRLQARWTLGAVELTDMPKAHGRIRDLSEFAAISDKITTEIAEHRGKAERIRGEILAAFAKMDHPEEVDCLHYRYLCGMKWEDIAEKMNYEARYIYKIHNRALDHYPVPETPLIDLS